MVGAKRGTAVVATSGSHLHGASLQQRASRLPLDAAAPAVGVVLRLGRQIAPHPHSLEPMPEFYIEPHENEDKGPEIVGWSFLA